MKKRDSSGAILSEELLEVRLDYREGQVANGDVSYLIILATVNGSTVTVLVCNNTTRGDFLPSFLAEELLSSVARDAEHGLRNV
ncbi:hypothetical protein L596_016173 [Steinernema carpocapsae]|uniref:Uncharacterized protein n=1 Tax=Steinernema carpocapsae TaxID=34508 RepID=A0A4U5NH78_STECR|nr:hypothetical protein L596_016173 [Steinernema carpocapsae]